MSKPFQSHGKPARTSGQVNTATTKVRGEEVDRAKKRRVGVNYGASDEPSAAEQKRAEKNEKNQQNTKRTDSLASSSSLPELASPIRRGFQMKVQEHDLAKPLVLEQRTLDSKSQDLLFPKVHGVVVDEDDESTVITSSIAEDQNEDEDAETVQLSDQLLGMPGNLRLDHETSSKYFGVEARLRFMQRIQWVGNQRNIMCTEPEDYTDGLLFESEARRGDPVPFAALRPDQFDPPGIASSTLSDNSGLHVDNEMMMLRQARLRSGEDFRDEEDEDALHPMRAAAREKDMLEDLACIMEREEKEQTEALAREVDFQMRLADRNGTLSARERDIDCDGESVSQLSEQGLERLRVRSLVRGKDVIGKHSWKKSYIGTHGEPSLDPELSPRGKPTDNSTKTQVTMGRKQSRAGRRKSKVDGLRKGSSVSLLTFEALSKANAKMGGVGSSNSSLASGSMLGSAEAGAFSDTSSEMTESTIETVSTVEMRGQMIKKSIEQEVPMSPRSQYISNCIREGLNPRASLIVRRKMTKKLELQNYGMGDQMAAILAESIASLPYLESINIADNRLTDDGMGPIILAAMQIKGLLELNLSKNEIGTVAAEALDTYLRRDDCPLQKLVMQTADVDDFEAEAFIGAVMENRSLTELDLSSNLIGGAENLNTVYPDLVTGSEALADLLRTQGIKLKTLKLVWNMIRLDGAVDFCSSLSVNETLTYLDLSYNSLAQDGGIALGMAIEDNHSLETLIIANNAIDAVACFTICVGVIHNFTLKKVVFDGNPIAEQGARALMLVPMHAGARVEISAAKCNVTMRDPRCWFDFTNPCRMYDLNLSDGFERAVAMVLLMVIACHHSFIFEKFELCLPGGKFQPVALRQALSKARMEYFTKREKDVVASLNRLVSSAADIKGAVRLFQEVDEDGSGEVDREELGVLVHSMGIGMSEGRIDEIFALYDVDGGGSIGLSEFLSFLKTQKVQSALRIKDLCEMPVMEKVGSPKDNNGNPVGWCPPREGQISVSVIDGFITKKIKKVMSAMDQRNIQAVVASASGSAVAPDTTSKSKSKDKKDKGQKGVDNSTNMFGGAGKGGGGDTSGAGAGLLSHGLTGTKLRLDEALACAVTMLADGRENTKVLRMVLPQMENADDALAIVKSLTDGDRAELMKLKREIGNALRPILGAPNGYYALDLSDEMDRFCMIRLLEISKTQAHHRQAEHAFFERTQIGDLSQKRNWSCFRNEMMDNEPCTVDADFASPLPRKGILQFDFICVIRPKREDMMLPDSRIVKVMVNCYLLEPEDALKALHRLKHYREACEESLDCDGRTIYEPNTKRAHSIGLRLDEFYDNLHLRYAMFQATLQKESSVKVGADGKVVDDLDDDDHANPGENNKDGISLKVSKSMQSALKTAGDDPTQRKKKGRRSIIELDSDEDPDNDGEKDSDSGNDSESEGSRENGSNHSFDGTDEVSEGGSNANESAKQSEGQSGSICSSSTGLSIKEKRRELESLGNVINETEWECKECLRVNFGNLQHCIQCNHANPAYVMGHGIDLQFNPRTIGTRKGSSHSILVKQSLQKQGRIEGPKKSNTEAIANGTALIGLAANEKVKHRRDEMDSDYSSELDNRDGEDGFSTASSSSSDDDGDDADIKKFMKLKIKERRKEKLEEIRAKKEARRLVKLRGEGRLSQSMGESVDSGDTGTNTPNQDSGMQGGATKKALSQLNAQVNQQKVTGDELELMRKAGMTDTKEEAAKLGDALLKDDLIRDEENEDNPTSGKKKTDMELFADKMKNMLASPTVHIGLKARRMIEWMEETFGRAWIMCRHLMLILQCFRGLGHKKQTRYFGTYRVDLFIGLFHRVVDLHNLEIVLKALSPFEVACVYARLGWLHLFNPCKPEGGWEIDLTRPEERLVAKMMCELATVEPGDNWIEQYFQWQRDMDGMPGWELTTPWLTEEGMPARGILTIYYYSGEGRGLKQCKPNVPFRKSLLFLVLIKEDEIVEEGFRDRPAPRAIGEPYMYNNSSRWKQYLGAIVDLTRTR